ncbi:hypothetical protein EDD80_10816 [Anseongella ginsenosidimutans]|uniref:Uncharacterized protein n=1 Tax=Anseongella ginsenosidimutans TaxID=496056 RepID=A0A4R3KPS5_9SPHI|nr:hypothetical protein [Anseongella ginsenosidimutans]QEC53848.1 hypothetical protein FRZ59_16940 [Anseongella ginsenosidimutans]TCS86225.1 hypothetical protein EDD80_10816 [Anseongella ginsenosidimutans]
MHQLNSNLSSSRSRETYSWYPRNELFVKGIIEDVFDDFLQYSFCGADKLFDLKRGFDFLDDELELLFPLEDSWKEPVSHIDKLVRGYTAEGEDVYFLVHYYAGDNPRPELSERVFNYFFKVWDFYGEMPTSVLFTGGKNNDIYPCGFAQKYLGSKMDFEFNSYNVLAQSRHKLKKSNNSFAKVLLIVKTALESPENIEDEQLLRLKLNLTRHLLSKQIPERKMAALITFLRYYQRFHNTDMNGAFEAAIMKLLTEE